MWRARARCVAATLLTDFLSLRPPATCNLSVGFLPVCDPFARVRPCVPCVQCVSRLPPVSFYRYPVIGAEAAGREKA